jgi:hypothetical protein
MARSETRPQRRRLARRRRWVTVTTAIVAVSAFAAEIPTRTADAYPRVYEWQSQLSSAGVTFYSVSCAPSTTDCTGVGKDSNDNPILEETNNGGISWTPETLPSFTYDLEAVSCISAMHCVAVGDDTAILTVNGGSVWSAAPFLQGSPYMTSLSCISTLCMAVGDDYYTGHPFAEVSSNSGSAWYNEYVPSQNRVSSVSCSSSTTCIVVGPEIVLRTTNAEASTGPTFKDVTPTSADWLQGVSCISTLCVAVGQDYYTTQGWAIRSIDGGVSWTGDSVFGATNDALTAVSCPTTATCVAVGTAVQPPYHRAPTSIISNDGGLTWGGISPFPGETWLDDVNTNGVSCSAALICEAAGVDPNLNGQSSGELEGMVSYPAFESLPRINFVKNFAGQFDLLVDGFPASQVTASGTLPPGLAFTNGTFVGTPEVDGTYSVTLTADNGVYSQAGAPATEGVTITVSDFGIIPTLIPPVVRGERYSLQLHVGGVTSGTVKWKKIGKLPKGLKLNRTSGVISGTPNPKLLPGFVNATVQANVKQGRTHKSATATVTLDVM